MPPSLETPTFSQIFYSLLLVILTYFLLDFFQKYKKLRHIPGPTPLPLIGNLYMKWAITANIKFLRNMRSQHGNIFVFWAANTPFVVVLDPIAARDVLTKHAIFAKGWVYDKVFSVVFGSGLVTSSGEKHKKDKALLGKYFTPKNIEKYVPLMNRHTQEMMKRTFLKEGANLEEFDVEYFFHHLALWTFTSFALDFETSQYKDYREAEELCDTVAYGSCAVGTAALFNLPTSSLLNPQMRFLRKGMKKLYKWFDELCEERLQKRAEGKEPDDCLKALLDSDMTKQELNEQLTTILSAGHDTSAYFGCYTAYLLAQHPEVQQKVKQELREVLQNRTTVTPEDLSKLTYLNCVLKESLRMYAIIPVLPRQTNQTTTLKTEKLGTISIPKGTNFLIHLAIMNRNDEIWQDPYTFNPDRMKDIPNDVSAKHGFLPFGYGQRYCIGKTLARMETTVAFALLLQKVTLEPVENFKPKPAVALSLVTSNGMKVKIRFDEKKE